MASTITTFIVTIKTTFESRGKDEGWSGHDSLYPRYYVTFKKHVAINAYLCMSLLELHALRYLLE